MFVSLFCVREREREREQIDLAINTKKHTRQLELRDLYSI